MGIVNITPDSFYDGGKHSSVKSALLSIEKHLQDGATFIDIGGYSSRPGADDVSSKEEMTRVIPVISEAIKAFPSAIISIDTFRSQVAKAAVESGAQMINDISGGELDQKMFTTLKELQVPYVLMHMQKKPQNMQENPIYENVLMDIGKYFSQKVCHLHELGIKDIILDIGLGFGKTLSHNYHLLGHLSHFDFLRLPFLVGLSRKSMLYKPLEIDSNNALNATTASHMIALNNGANILRVHDTKEAIEAIKINQLLQANL